MKQTNPTIQELVHADEVLSENDIYPLISRDFERDVEEPAERRWLMNGLIYKREGKTIAFLTQPYTLVTEDLRGILQFCERYDLDVDLSMRAEWNPGQSLGVMFWTRELNPFTPPQWSRR